MIEGKDILAQATNRQGKNTRNLPIAPLTKINPTFPLGGSSSGYVVQPRELADQYQKKYAKVARYKINIKVTKSCGGGNAICPQNPFVRTRRPYCCWQHRGRLMEHLRKGQH